MKDGKPFKNTKTNTANIIDKVEVKSVTESYEECTNLPIKEDKPYIKNCRAGLVDSRTLPECSGEDIIPTGMRSGVIAKIPVVLAEKKIQIDVESQIQLEEPAYEIKRIKKNLYLTQCKLMPRAGKTEQGKMKTGKLFIKGFIRKNIEYATQKCSGTSVVSGDIRHTTVDVPFECITMVRFVTPPVVRVQRVGSEVETFDPCRMGKDPNELDLAVTEEFTERIFCELEDAEIFEIDLTKEPCNCPSGCADYSKIETFQRIIEKMTIYVRLKVLQNQQVVIPGSGVGCSYDENEEDN